MDGNKIPMDRWTEPKSLAEMAAEASGASGWECPRCGCADWRGTNNSEVELIRHPSDKAATVRKRICRHCGQVGFHTHEVVVPPGHRVVVVPDDET